MTAPVSRQDLLALIEGCGRRQVLADALAAGENLPVGVEPAVTVARLVERLGILGTLWLMHTADWPGEDAGALLSAVGIDHLEAEAAMLALDGLT